LPFSMDFAFFYCLFLWISCRTLDFNFLDLN
jgi:hypothetical protein